MSRFFFLLDGGVTVKEGEHYAYVKTEIKLRVVLLASSLIIYLSVLQVWNRVSTVWPDFTHPRTVDYWLRQLKRLHHEFPFDGAWIVSTYFL